MLEGTEYGRPRPIEVHFHRRLRELKSRFDRRFHNDCEMKYNVCRRIAQWNGLRLHLKRFA